MLVERREGIRDTRIQSGVNHTLANAYYSTCANRAQGDINPLSHRSSIHPFHTVSHRFSMYVCTRRLPSQQTSCVSILIGLLRGYAVSSRRPVAVPLFIAAFMTNRPEHSPKTHQNVERGQIQVHFKLSHKVVSYAPRICKSLIWIHNSERRLKMLNFHNVDLNYLIFSLCKLNGNNWISGAETLLSVSLCVNWVYQKGFYLY